MDRRLGARCSDRPPLDESEHLPLGWKSGKTSSERAMVQQDRSYSDHLNLLLREDFHLRRRVTQIYANQYGAIARSARRPPARRLFVQGGSAQAPTRRDLGFR